MLIIDQLKRNDPQLRLLTVVMSAGLLALLTGLWWVQVVRARYYQSHLESQSYRSVRVPAMRGKILDRNGEVLAENRPSYSVNLYLEDLRPAFDKVYTNSVAVLHAHRASLIAAEESRLGRKLNKQERKAFAVTVAERNQVRQYARQTVVSNVVYEISQRLGQPISLEPTQFNRHYSNSLPMPYPVLAHLEPVHIARFEEQLAGSVSADLEIQTTRTYPQRTSAAHVLGHLQRDDRSKWGEEAYFSYRLPDYRGVVGVEGYYDTELRGHAGSKSVLVNNLGYRQGENIWEEAQPGTNIVLTIDLRIQKEAERALARRVVAPKKAGAVVVMDVQTGDILALVSLPSYDPNVFLPQISQEDYAELSDPVTRPQINRATQENYAPGSIFKTVIGMAALEAGLNPEEEVYNPGYIKIGRRSIDDLAPAGSYDFRRALLKSSNTYFITNGLRYGGIQNIAKLGRRLHLGERTGLPTWQDTAGSFPSSRRVSAGWSPGDTANVCIGQGEVAVTPLQMAVLTAAIANGGTVLWPRLVDRIEPQDPIFHDRPVLFPERRVRDELGVRPHNLKILQDAMLADTEDPDGTGRAAVVPGLRICGKTGTAQVQNTRGETIDHTTWFISYAPYENPRYAVVVMVESGSSGTLTCVPVAHDIYTAIQKLDGAATNQNLARAQ